MTTYHVKGWATLYENNRSRKVKDLAWVPIPNRHDGERYSAIWQRQDGPELFAAWILILQVASKCHPRGSLVRSNGEPHTPQTLAIKTRAVPMIFTKALEYFSVNGWLTKELCEQQPLAFERHDDATAMPPRCQSGDEEQNRKNGMEQKEVGADETAPATDAEWLTELQSLSAYKDVPVAVEFDKMSAWCSVNRKKPTRRRFINWLNRYERPMSGGKTSVSYGKRAGFA